MSVIDLDRVKPEHAPDVNDYVTQFLFHCHLPISVDEFRTDIPRRVFLPFQFVPINGISVKYDDITSETGFKIVSYTGGQKAREILQAIPGRGIVSLNSLVQLDKDSLSKVCNALIPRECNTLPEFFAVLEGAPERIAQLPESLRKAAQDCLGKLQWSARTAEALIRKSIGSISAEFEQKRRGSRYSNAELPLYAHAGLNPPVVAQAAEKEQEPVELRVAKAVAAEFSKSLTGNSSAEVAELKEALAKQQQQISALLELVKSQNQKGGKQ